MAEGLDVAMAGLQVGYENPAQFSANTAVCLAHRVHATSPRRLPRGAAARMDARNEAWQEGPAGKQAVPEPPRRWVFAIEGGRRQGSLNSSRRLSSLI
jgi:hypothetical protein